jgi:hypothetical protein
MEYPDGFLDDHRRMPICGILAVAICANVSFETAKATLARCKLPHQTRMRSRTFPRQQANALWTLGMKFAEHVQFDGMTVERFITEFSKPGVLYKLHTQGHVFCVRNHAVIDQYQHRNFLLSNLSLKKLKGVVEIISE